MSYYSFTLVKKKHESSSSQSPRHSWTRNWKSVFGFGHEPRVPKVKRKSNIRYVLRDSDGEVKSDRVRDRIFQVCRDHLDAEVRDPQVVKDALYAVENETDQQEDGLTPCLELVRILEFRRYFELFLLIVIKVAHNHVEKVPVGASVHDSVKYRDTERCHIVFKGCSGDLSEQKCRRHRHPRRRRRIPFFNSFTTTKMPSATIVNPATGRRVKRSGRVGRAIVASRKTKRAPARRSPPKSRKKRSECTRRRTARACGSNPNCSWRRRSRTCVRHKGVRSGGVVYEGPQRPV